MTSTQSSSDSEGDDEDDDDDDDPRFVIELTNGSLKLISIDRLEPYFELNIVSQTNQEFNVETERQEVSHTLQTCQTNFQQAVYYCFQEGFCRILVKTLFFSFIEEHLCTYDEPLGNDIMYHFLNDAGQIYRQLELLLPSISLCSLRGRIAQVFCRTALTNCHSVMQLVIKVHRCNNHSTNSA
ncbi:unnamed protein product [Clavelina lepadiformis]|uniref:Uncharacterized protein n=1 Tax=Clavelina lepadiformis TaxID=159417 RepID=A0ABP0H0Z2_CLALP